MLVLSRRAQQRVVFPHLGITLSILQVRGRIVKIGIEAPQSVKVLREEVADGETSDQGCDETEHRRRNELNVLQLRLDALQARLDRGESIDTDDLVRCIVSKASAADHQLSPVQAVAPLVGDDTPIRLLVVEDSDNERGLMAYLLALQGFDVHVARDGAEALEQLRMWGAMPDFVLMDMQMPLSDGLETLHRIRHDDRLANLTVFAVTGTSRSHADEPVGRGWDGWFQKPLDVSSLVARIREDISTSRTAQSVS